MNETTSKTSCLVASGCYDGAWDVVDSTTATPSTTKDVTFSNRVLTIVAPDGSYQDVVSFINSSLTGTSAPSGFPAELHAAQAAGQWMPADCAGAPCTYDTTPSARSVSVDWKGTGTTAGGLSVQRTNPAGTLVQTHSNSDWSAAAASTFGAPNP